MSRKEIQARLVALRQRLQATTDKNEKINIMDEILDWEFRL